ncbi:KIF1-binding protein, partial [Clarias magur]
MASTNSREWRAVCEKFRLAQDLSEIESRKDPENDPFRSRYKARELLKEIYCTVKNIESENEDRETNGQSGETEDAEAINGGGNKAHAGDSRVGLGAAKLGVIDYHLGVNHIETEELSAGEEYLMNCMKLLEECTDGQPPLDLVDFFVLEQDAPSQQERMKRFEMAYTHTLYYLAQVYKNLGQYERAGQYCHSTLQRQLKYSQFLPLEWAINAATLSQYYITKTRYMEARHCLAAANVIAGLAGEVPSEAAAKESEAEYDKREQLRQKRSEIARCWIKYCLNLLQDAKKLLE